MWHNRKSHKHTYNERLTQRLLRELDEIYKSRRKPTITVQVEKYKLIFKPAFIDYRNDAVELLDCLNTINTQRYIIKSRYSSPDMWRRFDFCTITKTVYERLPEIQARYFRQSVMLDKPETRVFKYWNETLFTTVLKEHRVSPYDHLLNEGRRLYIIEKLYTVDKLYYKYNHGKAYHREVKSINRATAKRKAIKESIEGGL